MDRGKLPIPRCPIPDPPSIVAALAFVSILVYLYFLADNIEPVLAWFRGQITLQALNQVIKPEDVRSAQKFAETAMTTMQVFGGLLLLDHSR